MNTETSIFYVVIPVSELEAVVETVIERVINRSQISPAIPSLENEPLCKVHEIAEDLDVTSQTIHEWKRKGLIPFERIGGRVYFRKSNVRAALKKIDSIKNKNR